MLLHRQVLGILSATCLLQHVLLPFRAEASSAKVEPLAPAARSTAALAAAAPPLLLGQADVGKVSAEAAGKAKPSSAPASRTGASGKKQAPSGAEGSKPSESGLLPQGELQADAAAAAAGKEGIETRRSCFSDFADVPSSSIHFEEAGRVFYLLTQKNDAEDGKGSGKKIDATAANSQKKADEQAASGKKRGTKGRSARYTLYKVLRKERKAEPKLSLNARSGASLLAWGNPSEVFSVVSFAGRNTGCSEGVAALTSVTFARSEDAAVATTGNFQIVRSDSGSYLYDLRRRSIVEMDAVSFQTKRVRSVPAKHRPLFWDKEAKRLVSWLDDGAQRGLVAFGTKDDKPEKKLSFKKPDRVLQQGGHFAALRANLADNTLDLQEIAAWSGQAKPGKFKLEIPPAYAVGQSAVTAHLGRRLALVQGSTYLAKTRWQRVFLFDYTTSKPLVVFPVLGRQYVHSAAIDPTGTYAVFDIRDMDTQATLAVRLYDFGKKAFEDIELPVPKN